MSTLKISELINRLNEIKKIYGDVPVVLWDMDTGSYFSMSYANLEAQRMDDGSKRISVGVNDYYLDGREEQPAKRPL